MTREQLLRPGEYIGLPKSLAIDTRLNATAKLVWAVLADRLGKNAKTWPGEPTIARDAGVGINSVKRSIDALVEAGWIAVERRAGKSNQYTLLDRIDPAQIGPGQNDPTQNDPAQDGLGTRPNLGRHPAQNGPTTRPNLGSELPNGTTPELPKRTTEGEAAVAAPPSSPASIKQKGKRKLSDEQKQLLCESAQNMTAWYAFGWDAVGRPASEWTAAGPPSRTNWAPRSRDYSQPEPDAAIEAVAAWTWVKLCYARAASGLRVTLPDFGKLTRNVAALSDRMTRQQYVEHVNRVTDRWPEIQAALGNWGRSLTLDEAIISVPQVLAQSERLAGRQPLNQIDNTISPLLQKQDFSKRKEGKYAHCYSN